MVESIGFVISLLALLYLFTKKNKGPQQPQKRNERGTTKRREYQEDKLEDPLAKIPHPKILQMVPQKNLQKTKASLPLLLPKKPAKEPQRDFFFIEPQGRNRPAIKPLEKLEKSMVSGPSRGRLAIERLSSKKDLLIYQTIMGKPKGFS